MDWQAGNGRGAILRGRWFEPNPVTAGGRWDAGDECSLLLKA